MICLVPKKKESALEVKQWLASLLSSYTPFFVLVEQHCSNESSGSFTVWEDANDSFTSADFLV